MDLASLTCLEKSIEARFEALSLAMDSNFSADRPFSVGMDLM
jgi:hypothetical protein